MPENPPEDGEAWDKIFKDVEGIIMPGVFPSLLTFMRLVC